MKVIKESKFENIFPMRITCKRVVDRHGFAYGNAKDFCGSVLEIEANDIRKHKWEKYPDYSGTDYGVLCPICGKFVAIDEDEIPQQVLRDAPEVRFGC